MSGSKIEFIKLVSSFCILLIYNSLPNPNIQEEQGTRYTIYQANC